MNIEFQDLSDFRVPIEVFREYSLVMKGLNNECQELFLNAMGINLRYGSCKIDWETFIGIYCLLKIDASTNDDPRGPQH